ncbi:MAG: hypothetical protein A3I66_14135 [Burkholderiales bacterium RIFCSPLOWO2_02_FULL_57_36]|nr:MAG: hypothetical protein A3I66_14135 [Burkholderiales bacterium RIFCSPLOWO2_02_FULL_57_36]
MIEPVLLQAADIRIAVEDHDFNRQTSVFESRQIPDQQAATHTNNHVGAGNLPFGILKIITC